EIAAQRFPADPTVQVRAAEALLEDRHDPAGALALLTRASSTPDEPPLRFRRAWLTADALDALGRRAEARVVLERLQTEFPDNTRLRGRLARADARPPTERQPEEDPPMGFHWPQPFVRGRAPLFTLGPRRLPEMGNALGKALGEFKKSMSDVPPPTPSDAPVTHHEAK